MSSAIRKKSQNKITLRNAGRIKVGIAVSEWHPEVTEELFLGAVKILLDSGIQKKNIIRKNSPGSFELPLVSQLLFRKDKVDAVISLGCVIKGETDHYHYICEAVSNGIMHVSLSHNKPVAFGLLTTHNLEQALNRAGGKFGNKGEEAAGAVLHLLSVDKRNSGRHTP